MSFLEIGMFERPRRLDNFERLLKEKKLVEELAYLQISNENIVEQLDDLEAKYDFIRLGPQLASQVVSRYPNFSLQAYVLKLVDLLVCKEEKVWPQSIYGEAFRHLLIECKKLKKVQGGALVVGVGPELSSIISALLKIGFQNVSVYDVSNVLSEGFFSQITKTFLGGKIDIVKPGTLTLLPGIYSLCINITPDFAPEDLEEISYFNFLSSNPLVVDADLTGSKSFLFNEVEALGGEVLPIENLWAAYDSETIREAFKLNIGLEEVLSFYNQPS